MKTPPPIPGTATTERPAVTRTVAKGPLVVAQRGTVTAVSDLPAPEGWAVFQGAHARLGPSRSGPDTDLEAMTEDVLALAGTWLQERRGGAAAAMVQAHLRHVLALVEPDSALALRLRARLVAEADFAAGESAGILALVEQTRGVSDPLARADVLSAAVQCLLDPDDGPLRRALATELVGLSIHTGRQIDVLVGTLMMTATMFLEADVRAERGLAELRALASTAEHRGVQLAVSSIDVTLAVRAGRLADAERMAQQCAQEGRRAGHPDSATWLAAHLIMIRWFQGRGQELVPLLEKIANSPDLTTVDHSYLSALALARALAGDRQGATSAIAGLRRDGLAELPRTCNWMTMMPGVATTARLLGDVETSAEVYELLLPYAHRPMMAGLGLACFGSMHTTLGTACLTTGNLDQAVEHFRLGIVDNEALGHRPAVALSRRLYAEALSRRGNPQDAAASLREFTAAAEEVRLIGIPLPTARRRPAPDPARCTREGDQWLVSWNRRVVVLEHSVGMGHLAMLLADPGREIAAVDLVAGLAGARSLSDPVTDQPVLDRTAVQEYRQRLAQLDEELAAAPDAPGRRPQVDARAESDWLLAELAAARGVRGQSRRFADNDERARIAVTRAIRRALERIEQGDPVVGAHLRSTVSTGGRCCYRVRR